MNTQDYTTVTLVCDGSKATKDKIKEVVDGISFPAEIIEVIISYRPLSIRSSA